MSAHPHTTDSGLVILGPAIDFGSFVESLRGKENVIGVDPFDAIHLKTWIDYSGDTRPAEDLNSGDTIRIAIKDGARWLEMDVDNPAKHVADLPDGRVVWREDGGLYYVFDPRSAILSQELDFPVASAEIVSETVGIARV